MARWSKLHYEEVARIIKRHRTLGRARGIPEIEATLANVRDDFAWMFTQDNPIYDQKKFMEACRPDA